LVASVDGLDIWSGLGEGGSCNGGEIGLDDGQGGDDVFFFSKMAMAIII
jgi:hypothetical protein